LADPVPVSLSEPNALLLDQAEWRLNDGAWQPLEEALRLENLARAQLGLGFKHGSIAQPWTDLEPAAPLGELTLRYTIDSTVAVAAPVLALENADNTHISVDGVAVPSTVSGYYVDESIKKVALPPLSAGKHTLELRFGYSRKSHVEWVYLLGDFGVEVAGRRAKLVAPVRTLEFGDITRQGLPFYTGNVTYHASIQGDGSTRLAVAAARFASPLLSVDLDGKLAGKIAFAPFRVELGVLSAGAHRVDITAFGHRFNGFGAVHNTNTRLSWHGPDAWQSRDAFWAYEYQLKAGGITGGVQVLARS
jgi:hypothetical protein